MSMYLKFACGAFDENMVTWLKVSKISVNREVVFKNIYRILAKVSEKFYEENLVL